jgi:hypothetical protein
MTNPTKTMLCIAAAVVMALAVAQPGVGQTVTTGTLTGIVTDAQKGVLPGATVTAVHTPTGTTYEAITQADGHFTMLSVRVGGPYTLKATMSGFKTEEKTDVVVALGETRQVDFTLPLATVTETVNVVADVQVIDTTRAGTAANISAQTLESLPTISRSITDYARLSPYFNATASNDGSTFLSVAGRNNRYNNIQIDGSVNNDLFGLSDSGTPGGVTGTEPISLDAIQELQLVVSPYDVRQGGFSGGGVNAITKSGTNSIHGTGYYLFRNQDWVGKGPANTKVGTFSNKMGGVSAGGPIKQNVAFVFGNYEAGRRTTPNGFSADGSSGQNFGFTQQVQQIYDIAKSKYGYDPGADPLKEVSKAQSNNKFFLRTDFNLSGRHRLTARYNYIDAFQDVGSSSSTSYKLADNYYRIADKTHSFVSQLNSTFGSSFNEFRVAYQQIRDHRNTPNSQLFPQSTVHVSFDSLQRVVLGSEQFSVANELDQDIIELTDDFTMVRGKHTFTIGSHNEFFKFRNLFIRDNAGTYEFSSIDSFAAGIAQSYDYSFSATSDPKLAARFSVRQFGIYFGDQWRLSNNLTLVYGLRFDTPNFPGAPTANPAAEAIFGYGTDVVPASKMWSPRVGFNYKFNTERTQQVRGGVGLFNGRTPYVWLSNQYGNTGIEFTRLRITYGATKVVTFVPDPNNQPKSVGSAATNEVDMIDPGYKYPQLIRGNVGYDRDLGFWGLRATGELLFSKVVEDIKYQNLNKIPGGTRPDGRPFYVSKDPAYSDVIFLTNTTEGSNWSASIKVDKPWKNGWYAGGSYIYGRATSIMDGTSSQAASNWGNVYTPGDPNNPPLATSNFDLQHRIILSASYDIPVYKSFKVTTSFFYNGQTGRPYGDLFSGDVNGDGRTTNDLMYVPRSADEIIVTNGTWDQLNAYINADPALAPYRGQIVARNVARSPWVNSFDFRAAFNVPVTKRYKAEVTVDVQNFINVFSRTSGQVQYANFNDLLPVRYAGLDKTTGKMIYDIKSITGVGTTNPPVTGPGEGGINGIGLYNRDDLRSRWQAQLGLRFRF